MRRPVGVKNPRAKPPKPIMQNGERTSMTEHKDTAGEPNEHFPTMAQILQIAAILTAGAYIAHPTDTDTNEETAEHIAQLWGVMVREVTLVSLAADARMCHLSVDRIRLAFGPDE